MQKSDAYPNQVVLVCMVALHRSYYTIGIVAHNP